VHGLQAENFSCLIIASVKGISDAARARVRFWDSKPLLRCEMRMLGMAELGHLRLSAQAHNHDRSTLGCCRVSLAKPLTAEISRLCFDVPVFHTEINGNMSRFA